MKPAITLLIFFAFSCNQSSNKLEKVKSRVAKIIDSSIYTILQLDKTNDYLFDKGAKASTLSGADIEKIEDLIGERVSEHNRIEQDSALSITKRLRKKNHDPKFVWEADFIKNPAKYYKQLIPIINSKGEKEVWVNCFCSTYEKSYWKKDIVAVNDGGSCFFQLKINLTKGTISDFMVNGVA